MPEQGSTYTFTDLSGLPAAPASPDSNPYDALITACNNDPHEIQSRYSTHRTARAAQQRAALLSPTFAGVAIDPILARLAAAEPGYVDPRHCLVLWARPPGRVRALVAELQRRLADVVPNLWLMPPPNLHLTALEITHSRAAHETAALVDAMRPLLATLTDLPADLAVRMPARRARLVKPVLTYDAAAVALSYLPAAGEGEGKSGVGEGVAEADAYTYHHLRRDLWDIASVTSPRNLAASAVSASSRTAHLPSDTSTKTSTSKGVPIASRYTVPSAHMTIARFITPQGTEGLIPAFVAAVEAANAWLESDVWTNAGAGGEWVVGEERGLDCRVGTLWYGGGETVRIGRGIGS